MIFKTPNHDLDNRISTLTALVADLTSNMKIMVSRHDSLDQDQKSMSKRIDKNELDLQNLREVRTQIGLITRTVQWGGMGLICGVLFSWNSLSAKVDTVSAKTDTNAINITQLTKENIDEQKNLEEMRAKIIANREAIVLSQRGKAIHEQLN